VRKYDPTPSDGTHHGRPFPDLRFRLPGSPTHFYNFALWSLVLSPLRRLFPVFPLSRFPLGKSKNCCGIYCSFSFAALSVRHHLRDDSARLSPHLHYPARRPFLATLEGFLGANQYVPVLPTPIMHYASLTSVTGGLSKRVSFRDLLLRG